MGNGILLFCLILGCPFWQQSRELILPLLPSSESVILRDTPPHLICSPAACAKCVIEWPLPFGNSSGGIYTDNRKGMRRACTGLIVIFFIYSNPWHLDRFLPILALWLLLLTENTHFFHFFLSFLFSTSQKNIPKDIFDPKYIVSFIGTVYEVRYVEVIITCFVKAYQWGHHSSYSF